MAYSDPPKKELRKTRLQVLDVNGLAIRQVDLTDVPNVNSQATLSIIVHQRCDMGHWHPVYGPVATNPWLD